MPADANAPCCRLYGELDIASLCDAHRDRLPAALWRLFSAASSRSVRAEAAEAIRELVLQMMVQDDARRRFRDQAAAGILANLVIDPKAGSNIIRQAVVIADGLLVECERKAPPPIIPASSNEPAG